MRGRAAFLTALLLTACDGSTADPGGATASEARQLNEAAERLDAGQSDNGTVSVGGAPDTKAAPARTPQ
ncbi:MAG: hypothetical protein C0499_05740 [Zymomonas sp.]|nr:hypothetical protein [Zymomonas sp.]PZP19524.1 MAG: hypothetical protein DI607_02220 [Sphingomonas hengshuiensis]